MKTEDKNSPSVGTYEEKNNEKERQTAYSSKTKVEACCETDGILRKKKKKVELER